MSFHVQMTPAQARAVAGLAYDNQSTVWLRQLVSPADGVHDDVYVTVHGHSEGFRISRTGEIHEVTHVLPA